MLRSNLVLKNDTKFNQNRLDTFFQKFKIRASLQSIQQIIWETNTIQKVGNLYSQVFLDALGSFGQISFMVNRIWSCDE